MVVGVLWDISWDASVGADSFWSPPHIAVNLGAAAAGLVALAAIVAATRRREAAALEIGAIRTPLGAGVALWGSLAMLAWVVLDDWWIRAYGLAAERWSPPEILFTVATVVILLGAAAALASASAADRRIGKLDSIAFCWIVGLVMAFAVAAMTPYALPNLQRTATFYLTSACLFPCVLAWASRSRAGGWGATVSALLYTALVCGLIWVLPRFEVRPLIGPIYEPVEVFLPPRFPLLLFLPALAIDSMVRHLDDDWSRAVGGGATFVLVFLPVQWFFSSFLLSPASDNWFFAGGGRYWPFYMQIGPERALFWGSQQDPVAGATVLFCVIAAVISARLGLWLGAWSAGLRR